MAGSSDVVVLGGGIIGCATAYFLSMQGIKATVVERQAVASCASGYSAGLLNPLHGHGIPGPLADLSMTSFGLHLDLVKKVLEETKVDPGFRRMPCVWLIFDDEDTREFGDLYEDAKDNPGFPARWLSGDEVLAMEPRISPNVTGALCIDGIGQLLSYEYTLGILQLAESRGAVMRHGTVTGLRKAGGRVSSVLLEGGDEIPCGSVVLALGPWSGEASRWLGLGIPVGPLKGQILRMRLPGPPLGQIFYRSGGGYVAPKQDGLTWIGTTEEEVGFDDRPTTAARDHIMERTLPILPSLANAHLELQTACLRPLSEDHMPILGQVPGWDGVVVATGAGRKGILLGPVMARAAADLVTSGHTDLPIGDLALDRFTKVER